MKRILLVAPDFEDEFPFPPFFGVKNLMVPLHLATIAALTPGDFEVDIWDEPVHGRIDESTNLKDYHLVGVTGYLSHIPRAKEIAQIFRQRGIPVAIGGVGVSGAPEYCRDAFDILFVGEAELTWPRFIADWKAGDYRSEYRQVAKPDLFISPIPRWDGLEDYMKNYAMGAVQTTRGCPFDCEFCDVIYLHGRRPRHKPIDKVLEEVSVLECLGMRSILLCDDNFVGNPRYAKDLLRELISLNKSFQNPLSFHAQLTMNVAKDEELLELLADANIVIAYIGIESTNKDSLKETNKLQNYRSNLVEDVKKIQSYGLAIKAAMIMGFDHDTPEIFDEQFEFFQETGIPIPSLNMLKAIVGTRLWARLYKEGRVLAYNEDRYGETTRDITDIVPKGMTRTDLMSGFLKLQEKVRDWGYFETRMKRFISGVKRKPNVAQGKRLNIQSELMGFFNSVDREARRTVFNIVNHTRRHAPFMLPKVISLILMHHGLVSRLPAMREMIQKQIELETSEDFKLEIAQGEIPVPENFKKPYKEIFPEIHKYVHQALNNKSRTDEALIEIFTDFIIRWGSTFEQFDEHYLNFLFEIANRTIARENNAVQSQFPIHIQNYEELPDVSKTKLVDDVFKDIEQKLRGIHLHNQ